MCTVNFTSGGWLIRPILSFWGSKVPQNGRFPAQDTVNHRAKCDAAMFSLGREIHNRTNTQKTNSKRYIHTLPVGMFGEKE